MYVRSDKKKVNVISGPREIPLSTGQKDRVETVLPKKVSTDVQSFGERTGRAAAGAAAGAAIGAVVGGPVGAVVGGVIGGAVGLLSSIFGRRR